MSFFNFLFFFKKLKMYWYSFFLSKQKISIRLDKEVDPFLIKNKENFEKKIDEIVDAAFLFVNQENYAAFNLVNNKLTKLKKKIKDPERISILNKNIVLLRELEHSVIRHRWHERRLIRDSCNSSIFSFSLDQKQNFLSRFGSMHNSPFLYNLVNQESLVELDLGRLCCLNPDISNEDLDDSIKIAYELISILSHDQNDLNQDFIRVTLDYDRDNRGKVTKIVQLLELETLFYKE